VYPHTRFFFSPKLILPVCNNNSLDGVGLATSDHPLGPFRKSRQNPILTETFDTGIPIVSTGHGSIVASRPLLSREIDEPSFMIQAAEQSNPLVNRHLSLQTEYDAQRVMFETPPGSELFYVHHGRNSSHTGRALYTTRINLQVDKKEDEEEEQSRRILTMHLTAADQPLPKGTTPISIFIRKNEGVTCSGRNILVELSVLSASGAPFELAEASNRVVLRSARQGKEDLIPLYSTLLEDDQTSLVLFRSEDDVDLDPGSLIYQRKSSSGIWKDVVGSAIKCSRD
jgi:hypothetical protein